MKNRIRELREDMDLTQTYVARCIGITQRKYSYIETGQQPLTDELLVRLANLYGVSIDYLLMQTDNPARCMEADQNLRKKNQAGAAPFCYPVNRAVDRKDEVCVRMAAANSDNGRGD